MGESIRRLKYKGWLADSISIKNHRSSVFLDVFAPGFKKEKLPKIEIFDLKHADIEHFQLLLLRDLEEIVNIPMDLDEIVSRWVQKIRNLVLAHILTIGQ